MWQEQFLKGVAHGIPAEYWSMAFQIAINVSKVINEAKLQDIENINEAHQKGYDLVQSLIKPILQERHVYDPNRH